jgi:shikimate kinase
MGAGKTVVGRCAAERRGRGLVDLDRNIEQRFGVTISEVFKTRGEVEFRRVESLELEATTGRSDLVVATGGGAFSRESNRLMIEDSGGVSVFLDPPWSEIRRRIGEADPNRPKWVGGDHARILFEDRRPDYLKASVHLELGGGETPEEIVDLMTKALKETACVF